MDHSNPQMRHLHPSINTSLIKPGPLSSTNVHGAHL